MMMMVSKATTSVLIALLLLAVVSTLNNNSVAYAVAVEEEEEDESQSLVTVIEPQVEEEEEEEINYDGSNANEPVCPSDYFVLGSSIDDNDSTNGVNSEGEELAKRQLRRLQSSITTVSPTTQPVKIVRQGVSYVEFTIQNTTWFHSQEGEEEGDASLLPDHIFTTMEIGPFGSQHCIMNESLESMSTDIMKAHCFPRTIDNADGSSSSSPIATIRTYARYSTGTATGVDVEVPKCCQDPYANSNANEYYVIEYVFEVKCSPSCDDPEEYFDGVTNGIDDDQNTNDDLTLIDTVAPTVSPTKEGSSSPTTAMSLSPTTEDVGGGNICPSTTVSSLSRDTVTGSLLNGPHWGSRHGWAWPGANDRGCSRYDTVDDIGPGANAWPCSVDRQLLNRILQFKSSYFKINFEFDNGMKTIISLPGSENDDNSDFISLYPSGGSNSAACSAPDDFKWDNYPVRLVRSGRYLHHWYAETVGCNGDSDTRIEIKVTPDCIELYMVSATGESPMNWISSIDGESVSSSNGFAGISYCVKCDSELSADNDGYGNDGELSGCSIEKAPIPTDCCPLSGAGSKDGTNLCGTGWEYNTCSAADNQIITTPYTEGVTVSTTPSYPVLGDGHTHEIRLPRGPGGQMNNDVTTIKIDNSNGSSWKKVKMNFHILGPKRITGVSGILRDPITKEPTGIHIQMSKNWHGNRDALYNMYWWSGIAHVRVPAGSITELELVVAYQYYNGMHGVSHSQLSLLGWATNGLWEEVGLGANGESITYEPHGHHRRQMILDTRPWLVCAMNRAGCVGSPDSTQWTENVGGGDFLNAVNKKGMYQYLIGDTTFHTMNGPRLTNATYSGITVDRNIAVSRTVSTWTADDFVRHLHSFKYTFLKDIPGCNYPRFAMYTLGGDNYNYVQFPLFAYGMGEESELDSVVPIKDVIAGVSDFHYTDYYEVEAPKGCGGGADSSSSCWFAMLTNPSQNIHQRGHRGIIVRNFHGQLDGKPWPPTDETVSPFTFNIIKSRQNGAAQNTASIELGLPSSFIAAVDAGQARFREGDYLSGDIELLVPPRQTEDYFGKSQRLKNWLVDAGVDQDYQNGWKVIAKEAVMGDAIKTEVFQGALERKYHPRLHVDCSDEARFNIQIPEGMPGILPITIAGVGSSPDDPFPTSLLERSDRKLWRYVNESWKEYGSGGNYQLEKDVVDNSFTFVYSLSLEFESDPVGDCEQFYFGPDAPSDLNPSCDTPQRF